MSRGHRSQTEVDSEREESAFGGTGSRWLVIEICQRVKRCVWCKVVRARDFRAIQIDGAAIVAQQSELQALNPGELFNVKLMAKIRRKPRHINKAAQSRADVRSFE